ncbi:hypothetical protein BJ742DRAFT_569744 [Cladochytrium replicatum]|nr:hypothetical protein BJ742DRAFT_569744 [Cladochytrium replicatum]
MKSCQYSHLCCTPARRSKTQYRTSTNRCSCIQVRDQLILKFGKEFAMATMENKNDVVNPRIVHRLRVQTSDPILAKQYLLVIARAFNVTWDGGVD